MKFVIFKRKYPLETRDRLPYAGTECTYVYIEQWIYNSVCDFYERSIFNELILKNNYSVGSLSLQWNVYVRNLQSLFLILFEKLWKTIFFRRKNILFVLIKLKVNLNRNCDSSFFFNFNLLIRANLQKRKRKLNGKWCFPVSIQIENKSCHDYIGKKPFQKSPFRNDKLKMKRMIVLTQK